MKRKVPHSPARPNAQSKYRNRRSNDGFVRYELQVKKETKDLFEAMASAAADEIAEPWDKRRRLAAARAQLLDELLEGISHEFYTLKDQIRAMKDEIDALTPSFETSDGRNVAMPMVIHELPDDPKKLKQLLANCYHQQEKIKIKLKENQRVTDQYQALYEASSAENDRLRSK